MYNNCKMKLSDNTIIREVLGKTYINEVRKHSVLMMTIEAMPLLKYLMIDRSYQEIKDFIKLNYEVEEGIDEYCTNFLDNLIEFGFLEVLSKKIQRPYYEENYQKTYDYDNKVSLEEEALEKQQLLSVTIELTYACNLKCKHCFVGEIKEKRLDKHFYFQLLDALYEMGTLNIVFTGGEVFARDDSFDIIEYAVRRNFVVDIFTNGTLIDNILMKKLCSLNIHSIQSSIYSVNEITHDDFVGQEGAFRKTVDNLIEFSKNGIMTAVKTCIFDFNCIEFEALKQFASSINATFQYTMTLLPRKDGKTTPMSYSVSPDKLSKFIRNVEDSYYYEKEDDQLICSAGQTSLSITPEGKVYMCNAFDLVIGDLEKESINQIWKNSKGLNEWRKATMVMKIECHGCEYANYCDFCPGSAYKLTGSPYLKYEAACNQAKSICEILDN